MVPAARQVLALLEALARQPGPVPAAVLVRELGLPRSTVYHLLGELTSAGLAVHLPEERRYGLGLAALELGTAYLRPEPLPPPGEAGARPARRPGRAVRAPRRAARPRGAVRRRGARPRPAVAGDGRRRA